MKQKTEDSSLYNNIPLQLIHLTKEDLLKRLAPQICAGFFFTLSNSEWLGHAPRRPCSGPQLKGNKVNSSA